MARGNGRRRRARGGINRVHREVAQLRREINGHRSMRHATNPPPITTRPFYPLRLTLDLPAAATDYVTSVQDLRNVVASQLGLSAQVHSILTLKLQSVHGWAYMYGGTTDRVAIQGEISGLIPNVSDLANQATVNPAITYPVIYKFLDFGTLNRPAHFGYCWPRSMQDMALSGLSNFTVFSVSANSSNATIHINLLWSTADIATPNIGKQINSKQQPENEDDREEEFLHIPYGRDIAGELSTNA